jgi:2-methylisocitrate lyase-like PEP mutase family enzyme
VTTFHDLLAQDGMQVWAGGCTPQYARMAQDAGFTGFFVAGSQVSALLYGVPDVGLIGMRDVAAHVQQVAKSCSIPILVDGDTGYGNAVSTYYAVQEFIRSGAAGVQFEDQEAPKKSGTGGGRRCIGIDEAVGKYRAAVAARDELDPSFAICARTDLIGAEGGSFESAVERCKAYIEYGGVDFVWLNSVTSVDQVRQACAEIPGPVLCTWGARDVPAIEDFSDAGLKILLFPTLANMAAAQGAWELMCDVQHRGSAALNDWSSRRTSSWPGDGSLNLVRSLEQQFIPPDAQRDYATTYGSATAPSDPA